MVKIERRKIGYPVVELVDYNDVSLKTLKDEVKESKKDLLLFDYPTVYVINDTKGRQFSVYVGETTDIIRRTNEHLNNDTKKTGDAWETLSQSKTSKMFVIGHPHFNKSLTLDLENKLMLYLSSVEGVTSVHNKRGNPQNKYYTSEELDIIFEMVWRSLNKKNAYLFPAENIVRNSALFKASPFHKLTEEQVAAKNKIILKITEVVSQKKSGELILVEGEAGAGKTVLMSSLVDDLLNSDDTKPLREQGFNLLVNHNEQQKVYQDIQKKLGWESGLEGIDVAVKPTEFLNQLNKKGTTGGIVVVDEGHLLLTAKNQGYQGGNHLKDLLNASQVVVLVYDENQVLSKSSVWTDDFLTELRHEANLNGNLIELRNQMRIQANPETVAWLRRLIDSGEINKKPLDNDYDIKIFDSPEELQKAIEEKNNSHAKGISRMVATYDWAYSGNANSRPVDSEHWQVKIGDWSMPWNYELFCERKLKRVSWIERPYTINEIGSTFTVQGFDLNYVGVILGPSVIYRDGKIVFDKSQSKNKAAVHNRKLSDGELKNYAEDLLRNELNVLMTRGVNGLYIFAVDEALQEALKKSCM